MGNDPATSVCDSHGRTHDHENLFVAGSPTLPNVDVRGADPPVGGKDSEVDLASSARHVPTGILPVGSRGARLLAD